MSRRCSLDARITEVRREIKARRTNMARWAKANAVSEREAEFLTTRMDDVLDTLLWLKDHERLILQRLRG